MYAASKFLSLVLLVVIGGCESNKQKFITLPDYDLKKPYVYNLGEELNEISGLYYYPKDTSVFAINDENGRLYKIYLRNKAEIMNWRFDDGADFEDLSLVDSVFYALKSSGGITSFKIPTRDSVFINKWKKPFNEKSEFEIMYFDSSYGKLVIICKDCVEDSKKTVTAFSFDPVTNLYSDQPVFVISAEDIVSALGAAKEKFKPSAAAIHPITHELYIVSSVNKSIVIAERNGKVKSAISLDPGIFKQPEGITFTPKGDMIISNESADLGAANIMIFKYKPKG